MRLGSPTTNRGFLSPRVKAALAFVFAAEVVLFLTWVTDDQEVIGLRRNGLADQPSEVVVFEGPLSVAILKEFEHPASETSLDAAPTKTGPRESARRETSPARKKPGRPRARPAAGASRADGAPAFAAPSSEPIEDGGSEPSSTYDSDGSDRGGSGSSGADTGGSDGDTGGGDGDSGGSDGDTGGSGSGGNTGGGGAGGSGGETEEPPGGGGGGGGAGP